MTLDNIDTANKIVAEYNRRIIGVPFKPDSEYLIENIRILKTKGGQFKILLNATNEISVISDIPFIDFIKYHNHPFDYNKFGLTAPMI